MLRRSAKAHLFPAISVYSSNAKLVFHFTGLSVRGHASGAERFFLPTRAADIVSDPIIYPVEDLSSVALVF